MYGDKNDPYHGACDKRANRLNHEEHVWQADNGRQKGAWWKCNGFHATHRVVVYEILDDRTEVEVLSERTDTEPVPDKSRARILEEDAMYSLDDLLLTGPEYAGQSLRERRARKAMLDAAPELCPYDSEGCHEHLYGY